MMSWWMVQLPQSWFCGWHINFKYYTFCSIVFSVVFVKFLLVLTLSFSLYYFTYLLLTQRYSHVLKKNYLVPKPLWTKVNNKGERIIILRKYFSTHLPTEISRSWVQEHNEKIFAALSHNSSIPASLVNHVVIAFQNNP